MNSNSKNIINLCRLCANVVEHTISNDLFHKSNKYMIEQIKELTGISFKDMPRLLLPRYFCNDCKEKLPTAYEFRRKIIKTQDYFKSKEYKISIEDKAKELHGETLEKAGKLAVENNAVDAVNAEFFETQIKDESINSIEEFIDNDEIPISCLKSQFSDNIYNANALNKTSHSSQDFDAVFLPLKKTKSIDSSNTDIDDLDAQYESDAVDSESDRDALENSTTAATNADDEFTIGIDLKKKYKKRHQQQQPEKLKTKIQMPKDPRKNPLFCYLCNKTFKTTHAYKVHCRKLHKGEKIFKCDSCEETFLRVKSLIRHNRIHEGGKLFECRYCDMSFNAPTTRIHHERAKHTKDWPFLCPICGKSFITTTRGKEHMTVHTKERPYKCELCKTAYLQRNNFKKHRRSELHKNNEKKLKESLDAKLDEDLNNENKINATEQKINS